MVVRPIQTWYTSIERIVCDKIWIYAREETNGLGEGRLEESSVWRVLGSMGRKDLSKREEMRKRCIGEAEIMGSE